MAVSKKKYYFCIVIEINNMKQIKTKEITKWGVAKKTKNIKAKPLISIMVDKKCFEQIFG